MSNPKVSVVTVNWNGKRFLDGLFKHIAKQTLPNDDIEVIMVDNNSSDDSVPYVYTNYPWVKIIENSNNDGFAGGNNLGMKAAQGKYIVLINNDTKPDKNWLQELVKTADNKKRVGAVSPMIMFERKKNVINNAGSVLKPNSDWPAGERGFNEKNHGQFNKAEEISAFCGASVLFTRKMLEDVGLFDNHFFMYFEDTELSWRAQKRGWKFYFNPKSIVLHYHTGTSTEYSPLFNFQVARNRILILFKHSKLRIAIKGYLKVMHARTYQASKQLLKALFKKQNRRQALVNMEVGIKVFFSSAKLIPVMLLKRINLWPEEKLS